VKGHRNTCFGHRYRSNRSKETEDKNFFFLKLYQGYTDTHLYIFSFDSPFTSYNKQQSGSQEFTRPCLRVSRTDKRDSHSWCRRTRKILYCFEGVHVSMEWLGIKWKRCGGPVCSRYSHRVPTSVQCVVSQDPGRINRWLTISNSLLIVDNRFLSTRRPTLMRYGDIRNLLLRTLWYCAWNRCCCLLWIVKGELESIIV
jgi:hypothetical protein